MILNLNRLDRDVELYKQKLIKQAKKEGITENFGQKELNILKDKYSSIRGSSLSMGAFGEWCTNYIIY